MLLPWAKVLFHFLRVRFLSQPAVTRPDGFCNTPECQRTAKEYEYRISYLEEPCDNFFEHACGFYREKEDLTINPYVDTFYERTQEVDMKIAEFFNSFVITKSSPSLRHIYTFYKTCTASTPSDNLKQIEQQLYFLGLSMKWPFLDKNSPDKISVTDILARLHATSVGVSGFLFKMSVEIYNSDSGYGQVIRIEEASDTILKNHREYEFMKGSMRYYLKNVIQKFHQYLGISLTREETEIFETRAMDVSEFLFQLKKINETPNEKPLKLELMDTKSFKEFLDTELQGGQIQLNWTEFLKSLYGLYDQPIDSIVNRDENNNILLYDVHKFEKILELLKNTSAQVFISAMWWIAIDTLIHQSYIPFEGYYEIHQRYFPIFLPVNRQQKCLNWIRRHFPLFVAHILATETDSPSIRDEAENMVTNIKASFFKNLRNLEWLSLKTRNEAKKRLRQMKFIIGYTDSIVQPSSLENVYETTAVTIQNFLPVLSELFKKERKKNLLLLYSLDSPVDDLYLNTPEVQIKYHPLVHTLVIPISILRFPFFNLGLDVLNYGAAGVHIAHGIARAFDYLWTKPSTDKLVECFQIFYSTIALRVIEKSCVDGERTMFTNLADTVGFKVSMDAYQMRIQEKGYEQTLEFYPKDSDQQLFTRAFANTLCEAGTAEAYRKKNEFDEKPINGARVNGVLQNSYDFAVNWKCTYDKWMNPRMKCKIWKPNMGWKNLRKYLSIDQKKLEQVRRGEDIDQKKPEQERRGEDVDQKKQEQEWRGEEKSI